MLTLEKRPCKIGTSINTRRELHGEDPVPAMDIPLAAILLGKDELNTLLGDKHAWDCLFNERKGKPAEPIFAKSLKPFALSAKFKDCDVTLWVGLKPEMIVLEESVKLTKLKLEPQTGGLTALTLTVQALAEQGVAELLQYLDSQADVAINFGETANEADEDQPELDLKTTVGSTEVKREKVDTATRKRKPKPADGATIN